MPQVFFSGDQVEISDGKARFGSTYYPIKNIGAVTVEKKKIGYKSTGLSLIVIGIVVLVWTESPWSLLISALGTLILFKKADHEFTLVLATSSGNQQAFKSQDEELFENVRMALEEAIAAQN